MTIYCPGCESPAGDDAKFCARCGIRLADPPPARAGGGRGFHDFTGEIGGLRIVGLILIVLGGVVGVYVGMQKGLTGLAAGFGIFVFGFVIRSMGGIWATLQRMARKS